MNSPITCNIDWEYDLKELHTTVSADTLEELEKLVKEHIEKVFGKNI